jgi:anti-sigma factor RsiW
MDRTTPTTHAGHDELLVARLYGGDMDASERDRALDQLADCPDCAALFADLGAIALATAALPVPRRPRDFTLTASDAARLGAGRRRPPSFLRPELRRSFGGVLAALGLVGVVLTGGFSAFGGAAGTTSSDQSNRNSLAADQAAAGGFASLAAAPQPAASAAATAGAVSVFGPLDSPPIPAAASSAGVITNDGQGPISPPEPSGLKAVTTGNPEFAQQGGSGSGADGHTETSESTSPFSSGMDARVVWLVGFALLFGIGLAILLLPSLIRRRGRGSRS